MYNLTVSEVHTYFVGAGQWAVHNAVCAGDGGRYGDLVNDSESWDGLQLHHMPPKSAGFTSVADGGAIVLPDAKHLATRTYGGRATQVNNTESDLSFTERLERDIVDIQRIAQSFHSDRNHYNRGLKEVLQYYRNSFPNLLNAADYQRLIQQVN